MPPHPASPEHGTPHEGHLPGEHQHHDHALDTAPQDGREAGVKGVLLPVAVVLAIGTIFVTVYLAAFHAPRPHNLPVAVVGTSQQVLRIETELDAESPGGFSVAMYPSAAQAQDAIEHHQIYAAYISPGSVGTLGEKPMLLYASANGPTVTGTVTGAFGAAAEVGGQKLAQQDVVPASSGDTRGLSIFYMAFGLILASYLFGTMTYQMAPRLEFRWRMASVACCGLLGGLIVALLSGSTGFGALHAPLADITAIASMMSAAAGLATMVFLRLVGPAGLSLASVVLLTLGNSTSGGSMPTEYLPNWLHPLSGILPVGVGVRAIQGAAYFHNDGLGRGIAVLAAWIVVCAGILYVRDVLGKRRAAV